MTAANDFKLPPRALGGSLPAYAITMTIALSHSAELFGSCATRSAALGVFLLLSRPRHSRTVWPLAGLVPCFTLNLLRVYPGLLPAPRLRTVRSVPGSRTRSRFPTKRIVFPLCTPSMVRESIEAGFGISPVMLTVIGAMSKEFEPHVAKTNQHFSDN